MPTLWLHSRETLAKLESERIRITALNEDSDLDSPRSIPLVDVDLVVAGGGVHLTTPLLRQLMDRGIPLLFLNAIGHHQGSLLPPPGARPNLHIKQYELQLPGQTGQALELATHLIAAKIYNQQRSLQRIRLNRSRSEAPAEPSLPELRLKTTLQSLESSPPTDHPSLLGIEGSASADFYREWSRHLPADFPFERRSRRPPLNPVNACLSFVSTLLYQETLAACLATGLDASLGQIHLAQRARWSLALDFMEPFRPLLVEAITLELFSRGQLDQDHFHPVEGGIHLNHTGRSKVILQYEKRMERHFHSEHFGQRSTLRNLLRRTADDYKSALLNDHPFAPFRMN